jgi:hypothetical protein
MQQYRYKAYEPGIKKQVIEMAINGSGIRDTARVLHINKNTVIATLKKKEKGIIHINPNFKTSPSGSALEVRLARVCEEAELDEQWSFVGKSQTNAGYGVQLIMQPIRYWLLFLEDVKTLFSRNSKACLILSELVDITQMIGEPMNAILRLKSMR